MGDEPVSRISGARKRVTVTGPGVEITGSRHAITCTNPGTTSVRVNGSGTECTITSGNPRIIVHGSGHTVRTTNGTSARDIIVSGTGNSVFIDRNALDMDVSGTNGKVRVQGNAGLIRVSGTGAKLSIFGNVGSITLVGKNHKVYVQGNCTGDIQIGEHEATAKITMRNKIVLEGSANTLRVYESSYRNQITSSRIRAIGVRGDENRIRANYTHLVHGGTQNLVGRDVACDIAYTTPDRTTHKIAKACAPYSVEYCIIAPDGTITDEFTFTF